MRVDIQGKPIEVGAKVAYFTAGAYDTVGLAEVVALDRMIQVRLEKTPLGKKFLLAPSTVWTNPDRLVVLEEAP